MHATDLHFIAIITDSSASIPPFLRHITDGGVIMAIH